MPCRGSTIRALMTRQNSTSERGHVEDADGREVVARKQQMMAIVRRLVIIAVLCCTRAPFFPREDNFFVRFRVGGDFRVRSFAAISKAMNGD